MDYETWEIENKISPSSPESYHAERAWNAAIREAIRIVKAAAGAEDTPQRLAVLLEEEFVSLDSGL